MSEAQDQMKKALKNVVVPRLRERAFVGSFPHFRRRLLNRIDLLTFQFDRHGGGFVIEISQSPLEGITTHWGKEIPPEKVTAWDLPPKQRARLKPQKGSGTDSWFRYDAVTTKDDFTRMAESVLPCLADVENMLNDFQKTPKVG
jgi:Domain of unknown function (DUF4304)